VLVTNNMFYDGRVRDSSMQSVNFQFVCVYCIIKLSPARLLFFLTYNPADRFVELFIRELNSYKKIQYDVVALYQVSSKS